MEFSAVIVHLYDVPCIASRLLIRVTQNLFDNFVTLKSGHTVEPNACSFGKLCTVNRKPSQKAGQRGRTVIRTLPNLCACNRLHRHGIRDDRIGAST